MKQVTLTNTTITTSALGFGCAGLMRLPSNNDRQRILATAFDHGIRHFDVARMYGLGKVEGILGEFTRTRREQVTITTKFGIQLNTYASRLSGVQSIVRRIIALNPVLRQIVRKRSQALYKEQAFSVEDARRSLETSLKELNTDYIDIYLMHECSAHSILQDDLFEFLESVVVAGKIRYFGIATTFEDTLSICSNYPHYSKVVQFENSILNNNLAMIPGSATRAVITHSALSKALDEVHKIISSDPHLRNRLAEELGVDPDCRRTLAGLLLRHSVEMNKNGIVLFHSNSANNITANIQTVSEPHYSSTLLDELVNSARPSSASRPHR